MAMKDHEALIRKWSTLRVIPYSILYNQVYQESTGNANASGDGGKSYGLMQINESVAPSLGVEKSWLFGYDKLFDPDYNLEIGTKYLKQIEAKLSSYLPANEKERWGMITMAYNSGPAYMLKALQRLKSQGVVNPTLQNAVDEMKKPDFGKTPIFKITVPYAQKISGAMVDLTKIASATSSQMPLITAIVLGSLAYVYRDEIMKAIEG